MQKLFMKEEQSKAVLFEVKTSDNEAEENKSVFSSTEDVFQKFVKALKQTDERERDIVRYLLEH